MDPIDSAALFVRLRESGDLEDQKRASAARAPVGVWLDVIAQHPQLRFWVAQNKTMPIRVLRLLADDPDPKVRRMVAAKRKLDRALFEHLAQDPDESVCAAIAQNAKCPDDIRRSLLGRD
jgi:hypothetical protein